MSLPRRAWSTVAVVAAAVALLMAATASTKKGVVNLTYESNFERLVAEEAWFVELYVFLWSAQEALASSFRSLHGNGSYRDNCGHCERVKWFWEELARTYDGDAKIGKVDIGTSSGRGTACLGIAAIVIAPSPSSVLRHRAGKKVRRRGNPDLPPVRLPSLGTSDGWNIHPGHSPVAQL